MQFKEKSECTFLTFSVLVADPTKLGKTTLFYTVANPARGLLNREKKKKKKSGSTMESRRSYKEVRSR